MYLLLIQVTRILCVMVCCLLGIQVSVHSRAELPRKLVNTPFCIGQRRQVWQMQLHYVLMLN